ncbi:MAG: hypothetical protein KIT72_19545 [Polyangiaceae bacterium]|nr:hypothetical protein [Polyangiaceae bacterium]MCW5792616.1 hypothetical protein [Polyangiaceae bacterium]
MMSLATFGCDSDDDGQGKAGSGGSGATGAAAGLGGAGGGAGGASGRAGGGSGGSAAGGTGAASGGGSGGSAASTAGGQAGGGAGGSECNGGAAGDGSGGACNGRYNCSLESLCCVENCGAPTSYFDADGCSRSACRTDNDCRDGRTCVIQSMLRSGCIASNADGCWRSDDGSCSCTFTADCHPGGLCLTDPPAERCLIPSSCDELRRKIDGLLASQRYLDGDTLAQVESCLAAHQARVSELNCGG